MVRDMQRVRHHTVLETGFSRGNIDLLVLIQESDPFK